MVLALVGVVFVMFVVVVALVVYVSFFLKRNKVGPKPIKMKKRTHDEDILNDYSDPDSEKSTPVKRIAKKNISTISEIASVDESVFEDEKDKSFINNKKRIHILAKNPVVRKDNGKVAIQEAKKFRRPSPEVP